MSAVSAGPTTADLGVIGLGVMGANLALNMADHGYRVALWNQTSAKVTELMEREAGGRQWIGTFTLGELAAALRRPRRIVLMIKAGAPVDEMIERLAPLLAPDDVVVDGGNSFFADTQRREASLRARGVHLVGMGVSGGEEGARSGPSLMPGGARVAYDGLQPILESIAAKTESGPCVTYVGPDGAGHFVKMIHNGIEYGLMQLIAEAYDLMRRVLGLSATQSADAFAEWNRGALASYLIEIASRVLSVRDPETGDPLVDKILDQAGQKGTGKWTAQVALDLGVPIPTIAAALDARVLSTMKAERVHASARLASGAGTRVAKSTPKRIAGIHEALLAAMICTYAQGMALLRAASVEYRWDVNLREIARIWTGGCIIRARLLNPIMQAFGQAPALPNLLLDPALASQVLAAQSAWRQTLTLAVERGVPIPAFSASLAYFDSYRSAVLPQNLTQAQRDYFGAHTYQRVDRPEAGSVHTDWSMLAAPSGNAGAP